MFRERIDRSLGTGSKRGLQALVPERCLRREADLDTRPFQRGLPWLGEHVIVDREEALARELQQHVIHRSTAAPLVRARRRKKLADLVAKVGQRCGEPALERIHAREVVVDHLEIRVAGDRLTIRVAALGAARVVENVPPIRNAGPALKPGRAGEKARQELRAVRRGDRHTRDRRDVRPARTSKSRCKVRQREQQPLARAALDELADSGPVFGRRAELLRGTGHVLVQRAAAVASR